MARLVQKCVDALVSKHGMTRAEAENFVNDVRLKKAEMGVAAKADDAVKQMINTYESEKNYQLDRRRKKALDIAAYYRVKDFMDNLVNPAEGIDEYNAFEALTMGIAKRGFGSRKSIDYMRDSIQRKYVNAWLSEWNKIEAASNLPRNTIGDLLARRDVGAEHLDFMNEIWKPGSTTNTTMAQAAAAFRKVNDDLFKRERAAGLQAGEIENYWPQVYNPERVRALGKQEFVKLMESRLDWTKTMTDVPASARSKALGDIWNSIVSGKDMEFQEAGARRSSVFGKRSRTLHFKDGKSFLDVHNAVGVGTLVNTIETRMRSSARRLALAETLGPSAYDNFAMLVESKKLDLEERMRSLDPASKAWADANKTLQKLMQGWRKSPSGGYQGELANVMSVLSGEALVPANPSLAKAGYLLRAFQVVTDLGMAAFSVIGDVPFAMAAQRVAGASMHDRYYNAVFDYFKRFKGRREEILREYGYATKTQIGNLVDRFDMQHDQVVGTVSKVVNRFYKWSLTEFLTEQKKATHADFMSRWFGGMKDLKYDALDIAPREMLRYYGIDATKWDAFRQMTEFVEGGHMLVPSMARHLDEAKLHHLLPESLKGDAKKAKMSEERFLNAKANAFDRIRWDLERDLMAWFADDTKFAVMEPDARLVSFIHQGTRPGTWAGEFARAMFQFKSFPIMTVQRQIKGRRWQRPGVDGFDASGAAELFVTLLSAGLTAQALKDVAKNRTPKSLNKWETWLAAMAQSGAFGIYSDTIFGPANTRGDKLSDLITGPGLGTLGPLVNLPSQLVRGEPGKAGAKLAVAAAENIPFGNLFYFKALVDWGIINRVKEFASPGYKARAEREMKKNFGQEVLWR